MPAIDRNSYRPTAKFGSMIDRSADMNESRDCAVRAVAIALDMPYEEVHALFKQLGREDRKGTPRSITRSVLRHLGKLKEVWYSGLEADHPNSTRRFIDQYPTAHRVLKNVTTHHPDRFPWVWREDRVYLFFMKGHVAPVVNGIMHDHVRGTARRVTEIWEISR